jgi:glycerophosphoryl diester phosphodiesterase
MVLKIGHRGAASYEPENTLRSFQKAIELEVDMIELDIRKTKDGKIVVMHDAKVNRTTNGKGLVKSYTFDQIRKLDAGKGEKIPTLEEVISLVEGKCGIVIELKEPDTEKEVVELIKEKNIESRVIIVSFYPSILKTVKELYPDVKLGIITNKVPKDYLKIIKSMDVDYAMIRKDRLKGEYVDRLHKMGLKVGAWTVDDKKYFKKLIDMGVDAITSNKPDILNL